MPRVPACRASQWASHFEITNVNRDLAPGEAYTYDLEWSPDAVKPPIRQRVRGVPPAYIECAHPAPPFLCYDSARAGASPAVCRQAPCDAISLWACMQSCLWLAAPERSLLLKPFVLCTS